LGPPPNGGGKGFCARGVKTEKKKRRHWWGVWGRGRGYKTGWATGESYQSSTRNSKRCDWPKVEKKRERGLGSGKRTHDQKSG